MYNLVSFQLNCILPQPPQKKKKKKKNDCGITVGNRHFTLKGQRFKMQDNASNPIS